MRPLCRLLGSEVWKTTQPHLKQFVRKLLPRLVGRLVICIFRTPLHQAMKKLEMARVLKKKT